MSDKPDPEPEYDPEAIFPAPNPNPQPPRDSGIGRATIEREGTEGDDSIVEIHQEGGDEQEGGGNSQSEAEDENESDPDAEDEHEEPDMAQAQVQSNQLSGIELYNGDEGEHCRRFIDQVETARHMYGWNDDQTCAAALSKLTGGAYNWKTAEKTMGIEYTSWEGVPAAAGPPPIAAAPSLKRGLEVRFAQTKTTGTAVDAVANLKQRSNETVSAFYDRVRIAMDTKNFETTEADKQQDWYKRNLKRDIRLFLQAGLRPEYRERVLGVQGAPTELDDIMEVIRTAEKEYAMVNKNTMQIQATGLDTHQDEETKSVASGSTAAATEETVVYNIAARGRGGGGQRGRGFRGRGNCFYCNTYGHWIRDCRKRIAAERGRGRGRGGYTARGAYGANRARPVNLVDYEAQYEEWRRQEPTPPEEGEQYHSGNAYGGQE